MTEQLLITLQIPSCKKNELGLAEFPLRAFRRAKGESLGPHAQAVVTTVLLLKAD